MRLAPTLLALAPAAAVAYALRRANEEPLDTPRSFAARPRVPERKLLVCLGASIFHGKISFDVVGMLRDRLRPRGFDVVNAGRNGDLAYNVLRRTASVARLKPDVVVVLVGNNDVMAGLSATSTMTYRLLKRLPVEPSAGWYRENLDAIAAELRRETDARIALLTLPPLGEALDDQANVRIRAYNEIVREVASQRGAAVLPLHERLVSKLAGHPPPAPADARRLMLTAACSRYLLGRSWDDIARLNGFLLSTDSIHFNRAGAGVLSDLIEELADPPTIAS